MRGEHTDLGLSKDFKAAIINMSKELKETMLKLLKEAMMTVSHQIDNIKKWKL